MVSIVFGLLAGFFLVLALVGKHQKFHIMTPSQSLFFFVSNSLMMLFQLRKWDPIFMVRYFLYIISSFLILAIPIILLALVYFTYSHEIKGRKSWISKVSNLMILSLIVMFLFFTVYNIVNIRAIYLPTLISFYSALAIFLVVQYVSYLLLTIWMANRRWNLKQASLIIVLGTEIDDEGRVQEDLKKRLDRAIEVYSRLEATARKNSYFLVTGGKPTRTGMTEAEGMAEYLLKHGILPARIIKESSARNTEENILFSRPFIHHIGRKKQVVIVTNYYHILRSRHFAEMQGVKAFYLAAKNTFISFPYATVREFIALILENRNWTLSMMVIVLLYEWLR